MWLVKKCKVIQVACLVFLLEGAGVAQPAFSSVSYVWLSPFYRGGTEALSGWASAFKVTCFTYDRAETGHQAVGFHSTCSSHHILIRDFISRHPGLEPIFPFGSDFLWAWALKWFSHLEELPQKGSCSWGLKRERRCLRVLCEGAEAQHPACRVTADKWGAILKTFGAILI